MTNPTAGNAMAEHSGKDDANSKVDRTQAVATQQAQSMLERKQLQNKVLDTIIKAFDLPSEASTDAANPTANDASAFRDYLFLLRPADLDEVVAERHIDSRCGYALCRNPNRGQKTKKVWDDATGKMVDKLGDGKWCSRECKERNNFVRSQLSTEPVWLRRGQSGVVRLPSDGTEATLQPAAPDQSGAEKELVRQEALAGERGGATTKDLDNIPIFEKEVTAAPKPPSYTSQITVGDLLEGLPIRTIGTKKSRGKR